MNRISTGIPGLDELVEGGFPEGSSILVSGGPGCGKSIFSLQYLYHGAKNLSEPGVYITLEEGPHNLWWNMQRFKWELLPLEKDNLLKIYKFDPTPGVTGAADVEAQTKRIVDKARELKAKRLVIDSITAFTFWFKSTSDIRYAIYNLIEELRKINCTTILTCETSGKKTALSRFGVEEFLVDGVVAMHFMPPHRSLYVRKMRGTSHNALIHPMYITDRGIEVNAREEILWEAIKD